jgi:hypothetical protein
VEWLGDLSCNLCFEDKFTASRALQNVSQEIPSPPTTTGSDQNESYKPSDLGNMGWRFCLQPIQKVGSKRKTQENSLKTPHFSSSVVIFPHKQIANDRHGRKGTISRVLMRVALSTDILEVRNSSWPEPPAGFSATQVLGPESDTPKEEGRRGGGKKKRGRGKGPASNGISNIKESGSKDSRNSGSKKAENDNGESLVGRGLSARRDGFSVEEMEQERARKRTKPESVTNGQ